MDAPAWIAVVAVAVIVAFAAGLIVGRALERHKHPGAEGS